MKSGWYDRAYYAVRPLKNGKAQQIVMYVAPYSGMYYYIAMGVFSCHSTVNSIDKSKVWQEVTSTNKNPNFSVLPLALECLTECENALKEKAKGKKRIITIDGMDERRLRVYTKVLTKKMGYKISSTRSSYCNMHKLTKVLI